MDCNNLFVLSAQIGILLMLIPVVMGWRKYRILKHALRIFLWFYSVNFLLNLLELLYVYAIESDPESFDTWLDFIGNFVNFFIILYNLNTFLLLGYCFSILFRDGQIKAYIQRISITLSILAVIAYILEEGWHNYGTFGPASGALFSFFLPILYLSWLIKQELGIPLLRHPYFLIALGVVLPDLIGLFLYFTGDFLQTTNFCLFAYLGVLRNFFSIVGVALISKAFWHIQPSYLKLSPKTDT